MVTEQVATWKVNPGATKTILKISKKLNENHTSGHEGKSEQQVQMVAEAELEVKIKGEWEPLTYAHNVSE